MLPNSPAFRRSCSAALAALCRRAAAANGALPQWGSVLELAQSRQERIHLPPSPLSVWGLRTDAHAIGCPAAAGNTNPFACPKTEDWQGFNSDAGMQSPAETGGVPWSGCPRMGPFHLGQLASLPGKQGGPPSLRLEWPLPAGLCAGDGARAFRTLGGQAVAAAATADLLEPGLEHSMTINKKITKAYRANMSKLLRLRDKGQLDTPDGRVRVGMMMASFEAMFDENREVMDSINVMTLFHRFSIVSTLFPTSEWMCREYASFLGKLLGEAYHQLDNMQTHHAGNFMLALKHLMPHVRDVEIEGTTLEEVVNRVVENAVRKKDDMILKNIAHTVAGVACFGIADQDRIIGELLSVVPSKLGGGEILLQDVSLLIWGLGRARYRDGVPVVSQLLDVIFPGMEAGKSMMVIDIIWGLGELEFAGAEQFLDNAVTLLLRSSDIVTALEAVDLIVGLGKLNYKNAHVVELLDNLCPAIKLNMYQLDSLAGEKLSQALNTLEYDPGDAFWSELKSKSTDESKSKLASSDAQ